MKSCSRPSVVLTLHPVHPVHPAKCPLRLAVDGGSATGTCWLNTRLQNKQTHKLSHPLPSNPINIFHNKSSISVRNTDVFSCTGVDALALLRGAAEQGSRTKGRLSRERSDAGSNGLSNQMLAGGVWRARPRPSHPKPLPLYPPYRMPVCLCVWCDLLPHLPDELIVFLHLCLAGVSWSSVSVCVRVCGFVRVCAGACITPPPGLISIWSGAQPERNTEGQWASWNSCGRKPSSYAIRSGYDNTFVYMVRCVCVFCESQLF